MGRKSNTDTFTQSTPIRLECQSSVDCKQIQNYDCDAALKLQERLGLGSKWGEVVFPRSWMAPGVNSANANRIIKLDFSRVDVQIDEFSEQQGILFLTRYILVLMLVPIQGARVGATLLAPSSIARCIRALKPLIGFALKNSSGDKDRVISRLSRSDLDGYIRNPKQFAEINRLIAFKNRGYWSDVPELSQRESFRDSPDIRSDEPSADKYIDRNVAEEPKSDINVTLPFSDEFIAESGWRMAWIVETLGPLLIKCGEELLEIYRDIEPSGKSRHAYESMRSMAAIRFLSSYEWIGAGGWSLSELPFDLSLRARGRGATSCWPPRSHSDLKAQLVLLQSAHLYILLLSTGGRISEVLSLEEGCIREGTTGQIRVVGRTYKLVSRRGGESRDWPVPEIGVFAVRQQERLVKLSSNLNLSGGSEIVNDDDDSFAGSSDTTVEVDQSLLNPIWRRVGTGKRILGDYNDMLRSATASLGLSDLTGDANPHAHRFRKTVARLLALALVDAPKILMDLFGHKSIEMTMYYMLSDPFIRAELQEVLNAQTIMLAENVINEINDCGGPAATKVKSVVDATKARLGTEYGASDVHQLAQMFTYSGKVWSLVRPGVICTKLPQQLGPCSKKVGHPEPSRCRDHCESRLERAALRDDVDRAIEYAFQHLEESLLSEDEISVEMWLGQIETNINRFPTLRDKWAKKLDQFRFLQTH